MLPTKRDACSSTFSDDFTVHMGPSHVADWPLGTSAIHEHYIKPVPPFYVTEYEANYTWPSTPRNAKKMKGEKDHENNDVTNFHDNEGVDEEKDETKISANSNIQQQSQQQVKGERKEEEELSSTSVLLGTIGDPWQAMECALEELTLLENETFHASRLKSEVHQHKLDNKIELAYNHYKKKLIQMDKEKHTHGVKKEIIEKMKLFCESVESIKNVKSLAA